MVFFKQSEFQCKCGLSNCSAKDTEVSYELIDRLSKVREKLGSAIRINSGIRCQAHQDYLRRQGYKTAKRSPHVPGNYGPTCIAADIAPVDETKFKEFCSLVIEEFTSVGIGNGWMHVDTRKQKKTWAY